MSKIDEFVEYLNEQVANHSIYVLGGQGEDVQTMTLKWLQKMESSNRIAEITKLLSERYAKNDSMTRAKCFDCSGLGIYFFLQKGYVKSDMTADMIYKSCTHIKYEDVRTGDFVFQADKSGKMHHIGYVANIENNQYQVIEAKGRSYGVVKSDLSKYSWSHYGRPKFWNFSINRTLQLVSPYLKGEDVKEVQRALLRKGYFKGVIDGVYGPETSWAVQSFQEKETTVLKINYGKVNKNTALALGFNWKE